MTYTEAQQYLESFINHEIHLGLRKISFKLERVQQLLKDLGDPQGHLKIIHVAGSKGKGSICALTASILQKSGYTIGLYTSPHLNSYRERIRICEPNPEPGSWLGDIFPDMISEEKLCQVLEEIKPAIEKARAKQEFGQLSFFELFTALALYYFYKQKVDFVILETGLGGRLDATNAVDTLIAVIAPISLEHTNILGKTIQQIAREKAAIIKDPKQKVIMAVQEDEVKSVFNDRCVQFDIKPIWVEDHVQCELIAHDMFKQVFDLTTPSTKYRQLALPLLGKHQRENCAVAVSVVERLRDIGFIIPASAIHEGLKDIFWPGRFEIIKSEPTVVIDGAHNESSIAALINLMSEIFKGKKVIVILGLSQDKDVPPICEKLSNITENIIFTKANHPRAHDLPGSISVKRALDEAFRRSDSADVVLVTGSIFVISEARDILHLFNNGRQSPVTRVPDFMLGR